MNHELIQQLRDAEFPYLEKYTSLRDFLYVPKPDGAIKKISVPTLSELIAACGKGSFTLNSTEIRGHNNSWYAEIKEYSEVGSTPEEAVARLWFALNQKK